MASQVDVTKPVGPIAYCSDMRSNFTVIANEITALQDGALTVGGTITGPLTIAPEGVTAELILNSPPPGNSGVRFQMDTLNQWSLYSDGAGVLTLLRYDDMGLPVEPALAVNSAGKLSLFGGAQIQGLVTMQDGFNSNQNSNFYADISVQGSAAIYGDAVFYSGAILWAEPTRPDHATTKLYVDDAIAASGSVLETMQATIDALVARVVELETHQEPRT